MSTIVRARAPLRLGLAGGGTDVAPYADEFGGNVLNTTISWFAYCTIEPRTDGSAVFHAHDINYSSSIERNGELRPERDKLRLHHAVHNRICADYLDGERLPITVRTFSDVPPGSGLGSSSTMVVAMVQAYAEYLKLPLGEYDIARLAYRTERVDCGFEGGKQDQYAATFGGTNFIEFYDNDRVIVNPLRLREEIWMELESRLLLVYLGNSRDSDTIIHHQTQYVREHEADRLRAMDEVKASALRMKEALLKGEFELMAQVLRDAWESKKATSPKISNEGIDKVYNLAMEHGAFAGKLSGAGGGGYMFFLVDPIRIPELRESLTGVREGAYVGNVSLVDEGARAWRI